MTSPNNDVLPYLWRLFWMHASLCNWNLLLCARTHRDLRFNLLTLHAARAEAEQKVRIFRP